MARFSARCDLFSNQLPLNATVPSDEQALASLRCRIVCEYAMKEEESEQAIIDPLSDESKTMFVESYAALDAFPYLRELLGSMAARLGFSPLTLVGFDLAKSSTPRQTKI